jgi:LPXTG-motif cell wall-anchored protein
MLTFLSLTPTLPSISLYPVIAGFFLRIRQCWNRIFSLCFLFPQQNTETCGSPWTAANEENAKSAVAKAEQAVTDAKAVVAKKQAALDAAKQAYEEASQAYVRAVADRTLAEQRALALKPADTTPATPSEPSTKPSGETGTKTTDTKPQTGTKPSAGVTKTTATVKTSTGVTKTNAAVKTSAGTAKTTATTKTDASAKSSTSATVTSAVKTGDTHNIFVLLAEMLAAGIVGIIAAKKKRA